MNTYLKGLIPTNGWIEGSLVVASGLALASIALAHSGKLRFYWEQESRWWCEHAGAASDQKMKGHTGCVPPKGVP